MKRRKFIQTSAMMSAVPATTVAAEVAKQKPAKELYEWRTYEIRFRGDRDLPLGYLQKGIRSLLKDEGCRLMLFEEVSGSEPWKVYALIAYPSAEAYVSAQAILATEAIDKTNAAYHNVPEENTIYNRFDSWLLHAFSGLPTMMEPITNASLFELRTYEAYSENAVQRKIKMFNSEEIDLFNRLDLRPVFFGEMIAGPYRPCLTYMLNFKDMEERNSNWKTFIEHPEWKAMASKKEYANTVSNIRKVFLRPLNT